MAATMSHLLRCYTSEHTRDAYVTPRTSHTPPIHSSPSSSFILFFSSSLKMASVTSKLFGHHGGQDVHEYTLDNGNGTEASIITYGAILRKLLVKGACSVPPLPPLSVSLLCRFRCRNAPAPSRRLFGRGLRCIEVYASRPDGMHSH